MTRRLTKHLHPGDPAPSSGQYVEIGPRGKKGREVTVQKGDPLPPTTTRRATYRLVDPTNNKSGRVRVRKAPRQAS